MPRAGRNRLTTLDLDLVVDDHDDDHHRARTSRSRSRSTCTSLGVTGEQVPLDKLTDLTVTMPSPPGWTKYTNPNFSPGTEIIAKNNTYPTAMLVVFKLTGNFDVAEAIKHANVDAEMNKSFTKLNASNDDFNGFPSAMIEGSYDGADGSGCTPTTAS